MRNSRSRSAAKRTFLPESGGGAVWGVGLFSGECAGRSAIRVKCVPVVELRCRAPSRMRGPSRYVQASTDQVVLAISVSHLRQGSDEGAQAPLFSMLAQIVSKIKSWQGAAAWFRGEFRGKPVSPDNTELLNHRFSNLAGAGIAAPVDRTISCSYNGLFTSPSRY